MTAWGNIELAVEAMRAGAQSFVQKPWDNAALVQVLQREVAVAAARESRASAPREHQDALLIQRALLPAAFHRQRCSRSPARGTRPRDSAATATTL